MSDKPVVLSIHAVDTAGEEGIVADARACADLECAACQVVTAILTRAPSRAGALEELSPEIVERQFESVMASTRPAAVHTGIVASAAQVVQIARLLRDHALNGMVLAPVFRIGGTKVLDGALLDAMRQNLFPLCTVLVVRIGDAGPLLDETIRDVSAMKQAARALREWGAATVVLTGATSRGRVLDVIDDGTAATVLSTARVEAPRIAGVGGIHATALAAHLARGEDLVAAARAAQRYIALRLQSGR